MVKIILFILLCSLSQGILAQKRTVNLYNYSTETGLPTNTYEQVYCDAYGFLWLASFDGLFRWDGYSFKKYNTSEKDPAGIDNNIVYAIFEDSKKRLWVGTMGGLNLYHPETDSFEKCPLQPGKTMLPVNCIQEDFLHRLWLGTSVGLCQYNYEQRKSNWYISGEDVIFCMTIARDNTIWLGTFNTGLKRFTPATGVFQSIQPVAGHASEWPGNHIACLLTDQAGHLWAGTANKGLLLLDNNGAILQQYLHRSINKQHLPQCISCLYEDKAHTLWIGITHEVLYRKRLSDIQPQPVMAVNQNKYNEAPVSITAVGEDDFGNTWFASRNSGLFKTNSYKERFSHYTITAASAFNRERNGINCFFDYQPGKIWIGTSGNGLYQFDTASQRVSPLFTTHLGNDEITDIKRSGNEIWIATWGDGIKVFDEVTHRFTIYGQQAGNGNSLISDNIKTLLPDDGLVWIGTHGEGLAVYNQKRRQFIDYRNNDYIPFDLHAPAWINHLFKDNRHRLWISTYSGLFVFDGKQLHQFKHSADSNSIGSNSVNRVTQDAQGRVWVIHEAGLDCFDERRKQFNRYSELYHLPAAVKCILPDNDNTLWLTSNKGIVHFDPKTKRVKTYEECDGLTANAYQRAGLQLGATFYFGGARGFNVFNAEQLRTLLLPVHFYFTGLSVFNKPQQPGAKGSVLKKVLAYTDRVVLQHTQSFFTVDFAAINLYAPEKTRYGYKVLGLYNEWIDLNTDTRVSFAHLPAGTYQLYIRFTDADGQWKIAVKPLLIIVRPAWWQTWWSRLLAILLAVAAGCLFVYFRTAAVRKRNALLREEVANRTEELYESNASLTRFFSILAHDLKNPVFALTDMAAYVKKHWQKIDRAELDRYLGSMHHAADSVHELLMNLLNWSQTQAKRLTCSPANWSMKALIEKNSRLLQQQLFNKNISIHNQVPDAHYVFADYNMIDTVIRNIISNCIRFTDYSGKVVITSVETYGTVTISITDNGIGMLPGQLDKLFSPEKIIRAGTAGEKGTGLGLVVASEFVTANKGHIHVQSKKGKGTTFHITLPASSPAEKRLAVKEKPVAILPTADQSEELPAHQLAMLRGRRILIVDDNQQLLDYLKRMLTDRFEVFEAANGQQALQLAATTPPEIIVTDLLMPSIDGLQFCREIRSNCDTSHIPVVILTAQSEDGMQLMGYEAGASLYMTKPVRKELLLRVIVNLLLQQQQQQQKWMAQLLQTPSPVNANDASLTKSDEAFLQLLVHFIEAQLSHPELDAHMIAREMAVSRTVLYAKVKALTGQTVHEFIKAIRLKKSIPLLLEGRLTISQVAFEVGFSSHSYFNKCFIKQYQVAPKEYIKQKRGA